MTSKDKGPLFALLWKTLTVFRSISNNPKEHHYQTKDKAENINVFRDLSCAVFFFFFWGGGGGALLSEFYCKRNLNIEENKSCSLSTI